MSLFGRVMRDGSARLSLPANGCTRRQGPARHCSSMAIAGEINAAQIRKNAESAFKQEMEQASQERGGQERGPLSVRKVD